MREAEKFKLNDQAAGFCDADGQMIAGFAMRNGVITLMPTPDGYTYDFNKGFVDVGKIKK